MQGLSVTISLSSGSDEAVVDNLFCQLQGPVLGLRLVQEKQQSLLADCCQLPVPDEHTIQSLGKRLGGLTKLFLKTPQPLEFLISRLH